MRKLLHETIQFVANGLDQNNPDLLPKIVVSVAAFAIATAIYHWLPDHDPANGRRAA